ncbi:terpenoid synthase [Marasmius fiardii PR-910]|nr:terpenoid synthase [Marasmius fiardii PR-910]
MSKAIDATIVPQYFQRFPVRIHKDEPLIVQGSNAALQTFVRLVPEKDTRSHAVGPYGDVYAICYPEGKTEKVKLTAEIIESLWMYDDITELLPQEEAALEHATVKQILAGDKNGTAPGKRNLMTSIFRDVADRMTALDPIGSPWVIETLKQYFTEYDGNDKTYEDIEDYLTFRHLNVGFRIMVSFMQWTIDNYLNEEETKLTKDFYVASGRVMALTNDYWSWEMEKKKSLDRSAGIRNVIPVVMKQFSLSEKDAKIIVKGYAVEAEEIMWKLGQELKNSGSQNIKNYVDAMMLLMGGSGFWSATAPRYHEV